MQTVPGMGSPYNTIYNVMGCALGGGIIQPRIP